jgi:protein-tyrosine-phosphatase
VYAADLILVMDTTQRWAIRALFGRSSHDVLVLGDLDSEPIETREIRDPVEQPREVFELSYSRIERCVGELIRAVAIRAQRAPSRGAPPDSRHDHDGERSGHPERTA